jgi:hypothetical protein
LSVFVFGGGDAAETPPEAPPFSSAARNGFERSGLASISSTSWRREAGVHVSIRVSRPDLAATCEA